MNTYVPESAEERAFLAAYDPTAFPPAATTADVVVLTMRAATMSVLLVRRDQYPYRGRLSLPGGFLRDREDADTAARRVLQAKTGVQGPTGHLEQHGSYTDPDRDPRMRVTGIAHLALMPHIELPGTDSSAAEFVAIRDVLTGELPLAFDHARILGDAVERAAAKLEYTTLATEFCAPEFTLAELRHVYEEMWQTSLDAANFRRKVTRTPGFVVPTGQFVGGSGSGMKRAELFRAGDAKLMMPPLLRPAATTAAGRTPREAGR